MSAKKTRRPSSPRRFFARLYGHLEATKKTQDDEDEDCARESLDSSPEITETPRKLPDSPESRKTLHVSIIKRVLFIPFLYQLRMILIFFSIFLFIILKLDFWIYKSSNYK